MRRATHLAMACCLLFAIGYATVAPAQVPKWKRQLDYPLEPLGQSYQQWGIMPFVFHTGATYNIDSLGNFGIEANLGQGVIQLVGDSTSGQGGDSIGQGFWYQLLFRKRAQQPGYGDSLYQNYPNPFNPLTYVPFSISNDLHQLRAVDVQITLTSMLGEDVRILVKGKYSYGYYAVLFDASALPSGAYVYHMSIDDKGYQIPLHSEYSRKMIFLR